MKKINTIVNIFGFVSMLTSFFSGVILWKILPQGQGFQGGRGELDVNLFLGLTRYNWTDIHTVCSLIFIGVIVVHLILHWHWFKNLFKN